MEINSQKLINLANKRFSDVLTDGFKLFIQSYRAIILPLALFQVVLIILDIFLLTDIRWQIDSSGINVAFIIEKFVEATPLTESEWNTLNYFLLMNIILLYLQNLIGAIVITIAMCSVSNYVFKKYMNENVSFIESFKSAFNKKTFLVILLIGICLPFGSLLLLFPAIIIFGFYIFLVFTYNTKDNNNPITEARAVAKGAFWKIIGVFVINVIFIFVISFIFNSLLDFILNTNSASFTASIASWYNPITRNYGMIILYQILFSIVDILFAPLFICLLTVLFSSLKAKKDLKYQFQQGYYPVREPYQELYQYPQEESYDVVETEKSASLPEIRIEGRFYCPFCGLFIRIPKKFCPKCGENLNFINK